MNKRDQGSIVDILREVAETMARTPPLDHDVIVVSPASLERIKAAVPVVKGVTAGIGALRVETCIHLSDDEMWKVHPDMYDKINWANAHSVHAVRRVLVREAPNGDVPLPLPG